MHTHLADLASYPRIELAQGYFLEAYFGWDLEARGTTWKLWRRRVGPIHRRLLVSERASREELCAALGHGFSLAGTLWNDFSGDESEASVLLGRRTFERRADGSRWFGVGTYVFDLSESDEALLARAQSRIRSKIRSTRRAGFRSDMLERPKREEVAPFLLHYRSMASRRGLAPLDEPALERMLANGDAILARALDPQGVPRTWNVIYLTAVHGYYLHGAHDDSVEEAAGHQLHMDTLSYVRGRGRHYYDFGLVASSDPNEGIHRFKRSLGGIFLPSGAERRTTSRLYELLVPLARRARAGLR